jgi:hypothetical protein
MPAPRTHNSALWDYPAREVQSNNNRAYYPI